MSSTQAEQPEPVPNDGTPIWELVIKDAEVFMKNSEPLIRDMRERDAIGEARYGTRLQAFNGRDALVDAYQESLDLCVYLRQYLEEHKEYGSGVFTAYAEALGVCYSIKRVLDQRGEDEVPEVPKQ